MDGAKRNAAGVFSDGSHWPQDRRLERIHTHEESIDASQKFQTNIEAYITGFLQDSLTYAHITTTASALR